METITEIWYSISYKEIEHYSQFGNVEVLHYDIIAVAADKAVVIDTARCVHWPDDPEDIVDYINRASCGMLQYLMDDIDPEFSRDLFFPASEIQTRYPSSIQYKKKG